MFPTIQESIQQALDLIPHIPAERKVLLNTFADFIASKAQNGEVIQTNTICTHNSRRSHLGQVWIQVMAAHFGIKNVQAFSGGTEATACHPHTIAALKAQGFEISSTDGANPIYSLQFTADQKPIQCWSKKYDDKANPQANFVAIMVCGSADGACPIVFGADLRLSCTYIDPKISDGTPEQDATYQARSLQIAAEMAYAFCTAAAKLGQPCSIQGCC